MKIIRNALKSELNLRTEMDFPTKGIEFVDINPLNNWDTSSVTSMQGVFAYCYLVEVDLSGFNMSKVITHNGKL